jgi:hypothetical protein
MPRAQEVVDVVMRFVAEIREELRPSPKARSMFRLWPEPGAAAYRASLRAAQRASASA